MSLRIALAAVSTMDILDQPAFSVETIFEARRLVADIQQGRGQLHDSLDTLLGLHDRGDAMLNACRLLAALNCLATSQEWTGA